MARNWFPEERRKQSEIIRKTEPWKKSTGPKSAAGKLAVSQNALQHGRDSAEMLELFRLLRLQRAFIKAFRG